MTTNTLRASAIYEGTVRHRRKQPVVHEFEYRVFMMYIDLDEIPELFEGSFGWEVEQTAPAAFHREDYFGDPKTPLSEAVRDAVAAQTGTRPAGPIRMLTNLRYFGYCFNPVTFYYCFDPTGSELETVLAEITNTPWKERHSYVLHRERATSFGRTAGGDSTLEFSFPKQFHVSPFIDMNVDYRWCFSTPADRLAVHMDDLKNGDRFFDATLELERREITSWSTASVLIRYPWITARTLAAIYWQALRLHLKKCTFYPHPKLSEEADASTGPTA